MVIFLNTSTNKSSTIPMVRDLDIDLEAFNTFSYIEREAFDILSSHKRAVYIGMKENSEVILTEGLKDFLNDAAEFFKNLAKKIIDFAKNMMMRISSHFMDFSRFLEKNAEYLRSLDVSFTYSGHDYTFPKDIPVLKPMHNIVNTYNNEVLNIETMKMAEVSKKKEEFVNFTNKNKLRASILGSTNEVSEDKFAEMSKLTFRSSLEKGTINVNTAYISKIIDDYKNLKTTLNETETIKKQIVRLLGDLQVFFEKKAYVRYVNDNKTITASNIDIDSDNRLSRSSDNDVNYDYDKLTTINAFFDLKLMESKFISNCVRTIYIDKINAIHGCMGQYESIIRRALVDKKDKDKSSNATKLDA